MSEWEPPEEFDDYVIEKPLGGGAMGRVFLAQDAVLARPVAVKFIASVEPDSASRQRFLLEARATARLQHPNVVAIYRVGELEAKPYIVSEFVRGETLDKLPLPLPSEKVLSLGLELARGLAAAHRRGVIHADIKPANAIVNEDGIPKLFDFGLATIMDASTEGKPRHARSIVGTPDYMAPELWRGAAADRRTDVYAFGAMLYHLLAGAPPFHDVPARDIAKVVQDRPAPPLKVGSNNARLVAVIDRCLARDPAERWASGDELREALEQCRVVETAAPVLPAGNPYRGLRPFEADHRLLFFGRTAELGVVLDRLRAEPFLMVSGDSGSGKSSLCRAAVLPAVVDGALGDGRTWSGLQMVPGRRPLRALAGALADSFAATEDELVDVLRGDGAHIRSYLRDKLGAGKGLVLFVDQFEELATIAEPDEAGAADRALARLASGVPGFRLLATARSDFLGRLAALPDIGEQLTRALMFLRPLGVTEIREVIVGPAEATGVTFETEAMVDQLVEATAGAEGGLPLLQFALAELWAARSTETNTITAAALASLGGVDGALSRHADSVIAGMTPAQRAKARVALTRLVTPEGTRARRTDTELTAGDATAHAALDALVRGRLLVAHEADDGSAYELSHEVLVRGWGTLRGWLVEDADQRLLQDRVHAAALEWDRQKRSRDALWGKRALDEASRLREGDLAAVDREFLTASRAAVRRSAWLLRIAIVAVPAGILAIYFGTQYVNQRALDREVDGLRRTAVAALAAADAADHDAGVLRTRVLGDFDRNAPTADAAWTGVVAAEAKVDRLLATAGRAFEVAFARDPSRTDNRHDLAQILVRRAARSETAGDLQERDELIERVKVYDADGSIIGAWQRPATIQLAIRPPTARVELQSYGPDGRLTGQAREVGPGDPVAVDPGVYRVVAHSGDFVVRYPFAVGRGGAGRTIEFEVPRRDRVPPGFILIPDGPFQFGIVADEDARKVFYAAQPLHERTTAAFLIAEHETTWAEWIRYLDALPPAERADALPVSDDTVSRAGAVALRQEPRGWVLALSLPDGAKYELGIGEPIRQADRADQVWTNLPVTGITGKMMERYTAWLAGHGVEGARLCSELEWERAARGADGRMYPQGMAVLPDEANYSYPGRPDADRRLDEVGRRPASNSPFEVTDMLGNAFELAKSEVGVDPGVGRGGSYFYDLQSCQVPNRNPFPMEYRSPQLGFRVCASWPP
jgi:eukaryotic-like serine/threonine-protein kinase